MDVGFHFVTACQSRDVEIPQRKILPLVVATTGCTSPSRDHVETPQRKILPLVVATTGCTALARTIFQTTLPFAAHRDFFLSDGALGWVLGLGLAAATAANVVLVEPVLKFFEYDQKAVVAWSTAAAGGCLLAFSLGVLVPGAAGLPVPLWAVIVPFQVANAVSETVMLSLAAAPSTTKLPSTGVSSSTSCSGTSGRKREFLKKIDEKVEEEESGGDAKTSVVESAVTQQDEEETNSSCVVQYTGGTGSAISFLHATWGVVELIGPLLGAQIYRTYGSGAVGAASGALMAAGVGPML